MKIGYRIAALVIFLYVSFSPTAIQEAVPQVKEEEAKIKIENADTIWEAGLAPSENLQSVAKEVLPRIFTEYADSGFLRDLIEPQELMKETKDVPLRIITEYVDSSFVQNLKKPDKLEDMAKTVSPRIIIENVTSVLSIDLVPFPSGLWAKQMEIKAIPDKLIAEGSQTATITITLKDEYGKPVTDETMTITATSGEVSKVKNNRDGTYSATFTAGKQAGEVTLKATATKSGISKSITITLISCSVPVFKTTLALDKGINMISLPLNPDIPYTASSLATALNSTIVIRVEDGHFDAYVHRGSIGNDFEIQMGKGYIVNLMEAQTFNITGKPWGEPVPAAPSTSTSVEPWAFVIAGWVEGEVPKGSQLRATNLRTKESIIVPISPSGQFTAAFVDMNQRPVIAEGDEILIQLTGMSGVSLTEAKRYIISHKEIAQAYLIAHLSARPEQTQLLQNYPNPFNPETWIPYQLARPADVAIHIYNAQGQLIHTFFLGQQNAGFYLNQSKAAYWNGKNTSEEKVASGIYFYQLTAGDFTATRRMVIVK